MKKILSIILLSRLFFHFSTDLTGKTVLITGRVLREPAVYEDSQRVSLQDYTAYISKYPEVNYGDTITLKGIVNKRTIDNVEVINIKKSNFLLFKLRNILVSNLTSYLPVNHSAIVAGVTLGSQKNISQEFWEDLKRTGTAHIVVASGTNVTYTSFFLLSVFLSFVRRKTAIYATLLGVWVYVAMSGFDPPLVRAAIMGSLVFSAQAFGRVSDSVNILLYSVILMLIVKPTWTRDVGFALSFYATTALILFESSIYRLIYKIPDMIRKDLSTTLTAQIGVAPILYITFRQFNILSPIYNIMILWTVPPIMILGTVSGLLSLFSSELGKLFSMLIYPFTSWFIFVTNI